MDNIQINYFLEVCNHLNFTKASNALFVSQSTISKKIKQLELELGVELFDRDNKKVVLTESGKILRDLFLKHKKEFEEAINKCLYTHDAQTKNIKIGIIEGWSLKEVLVKFNECSFKSYILESEKISKLLYRLKENQIDVIIGSKKGIVQAININNLDNIKYEVIFGVPRICYFSNKHPLANKENLKLIDFKNDTLYRGFSQVAKEVILDTCENEGFIPKVDPCLNLETILNRLSLGKGYAIGDLLLRVVTDNDFKYFKLPYTQEVAIAYLADLKDKNKLHYIKEIITVAQSVYNSKTE